MPAARYTATAASQRVVTVSDNPDGVSVRNTSRTLPVYLDDVQQQNTTGGVELPPLATQQWAAKRDLWVVAPAPVDVDVSQAAGTVADPTGIADALLAQGLPEAIAANIKVEGAPSIDNPAILLNYNGNVPNTNLNQIGTFVCTEYQTVSFVMQAYAAATAPAPATPTSADMGQLLIYHYQEGIFIGSDNVRFLSDNGLGNGPNASSRLVIPARGDEMVVYLAYGTTGVNVRVRAIGSYRQAQEATTFYGGHGWWDYGSATYPVSGDAGLLSWNIAGMPAGTEYEYPTLYSGPCDFTVDTAGALTPSLVAELRDVRDDTFVEGFFLAAGTGRGPVTKQCIIPQRPLKLRVSVIGAGALGALARVVLKQERGR